MLHLESCLGVSKPLLDDKTVGVDDNRREALKRFSKWVPCQCRRPCRREWNFVNDIGLCRGGEEGKCAVANLFERTQWGLVFAGNEIDALQKTWRLWSAA